MLRERKVKAVEGKLRRVGTVKQQFPLTCRVHLRLTPQKNQSENITCLQSF